MTLDSTNSVPSVDVPADTSGLDSSVDNSSVDTFDSDYYGDFSDDGSDSQDTNEGTLEGDAGEGEDAKFIQDGIDLTHIPEDLRGETLQDTLKKIDEARTAANKEKDISQLNLDNIRKTMGLDESQDSFVVQFQRNMESVEVEADRIIAAEKARLQNLVDNNGLSEAEANLQYGQFKREIEMQKVAYKQESHSATNLAIVENFIKQNEEVLKNPLIAEAAETLLKDVITDGNIVSTERSVAYLNMGKKIFDEGYKQGLAAAQQSTANQQVQGVKKQLQNPQVARGGSPPKQSGIPYATAADVPQHIWNSNEKVRNYFLSMDSFPLN